MNNYLVMVRAQISTIMTVAANDQAEATERAQRLFESVNNPKVEMVLGEVISSQLPPFNGESP